MTLFQILAGVMSLLALLFVVIPVLRKPADAPVNFDEINSEIGRARFAELDMDLKSGRLGQAEYDAARADLERELLHDLSQGNKAVTPAHSGRWAALVIAIGVPLGAALLYKTIGNEPVIALLEEAPAVSARQETDSPPAPQLSLDELVERLARRLETQPDDLRGWVMLARSYTATNQHALAVDAYRNVLRLGGENASLLADYVDALATANNGRFPGESGELLERALSLDPDNIKALWLAGHWKVQTGDPAAAVEHWEHAARQMQPESKDREIIARQIAQLREQTGLPAATPATDSAEVAQATESKPGALSVSVSLDPSLQEQARPDDTVFVYARAANGPRMPLAIVRKQVADLPVTVTLDDSMAMSPSMVLSGFDPVYVGARISRSGNAMPQSGDIRGSQSPVSTGGGATVNIVINEVVP